MNKTELALSLEDFITGSGGGKGSSHTPVEAPNTLQSRATIKVVEVVSEGEIVGLVGGLKGVYLDDTPIQNGDGSFNFPAVKFEERTGTPSQSYIPGFSDVESAILVNVEIDAPVVRSVTTADVDAVRLTVRLPQGLSQMDTSSGDLNGYRIGIAIDTRPTGGTWTQIFTKTITGKTISAYEESYRVEKPAGISTVWDVRIRRTTQKANSASVADRIDLFALTEIQDLKISYPNAAVIGLAIDADSTGGRVPARSYLLDGLIIKVPTNYTPTVYNDDGSVLSYASYSGTWNGAFKNAWCDDPAWILYDLLTNERYGMGEYIDTSNIDIYSFYDASKYNCELVDDGTGTDTLEPRFRCNVPIQSRADAFKVLQSVAANMRAGIFSGPGYLKLIQDRPQAPTATLTNANVIEGQFVYMGADLSSRITAVDVTYNNRKDRYLPATVTEEADADTISAYGFNKIEMTALGVVDEGQARRLAKWVIDNTTSNTEAVSFKVSWNNAFVEVGDVVNIADNFYAAEQFSGILKSGGSGVNQVKLDRTVTVTSGQTIKFMDLTGVEHTRTIATSTTSDTLALTILAGAVDPSLYAGCPYSILGVVSPRQFKIAAVKEASPGVYELAATVHDPYKYARVEQGVYVTPPTFSTLDASTIAAPANVVVNPETYLDVNGAIKYRLRFNWDDVNNVFLKGYKIRIRRNNGQYAWTGMITQSEYRFNDVQPGVFEYTVYAYNTKGKQSPGTDGGYQLKVADGDPSLLSAPTGLQLVGGGTSFMGTKFDIEWTPPAPTTAATLKDYEVKIYDSGTLVKRIYQTQTTLTITNTDIIAWAGRAMRSITIDVACRDTLNRYSVPVETVFTNAAPAVSAGASLSTEWQYYVLTHTVPTEPDVAGVVIYHSETSGFTPGPDTLAKDDTGVMHFVEAEPDKTYYVRFAIYDSWGKDDLNFHDEMSIYTQSESALAQEISDRIAAVETETNARIAAINQEIADRQAAITAEATTRANDITAEATARANAITQEIADRTAAVQAEADARAQALLDYDATVQAALTEERNTRQSEDESLAASIATIVAGNGEQFDSKSIWYFDSSLESWSGNGTPTVAGGFLRPADSLTDPYITSPTGIAVDGDGYKYVKMRVKRVGTPTWEGALRWRNVGDAAGVWSGPATVTEPAFDTNGIGTIDFKELTWTGTIDQIRIDASSNQTATDYYQFDWIAVGRPAPGASVAALQEEKTARTAADTAEANARTTLAAQMRGSYTGTDIAALSTGLLYNERVARVSADSAMASDITALKATVNDPSTGVAANGSAINSLTTRVTTIEGVNTSQSSAITALQNTVNNSTTGVVATANGLSALDTRVTSAEGVNTSQGTAITNLQNTVNDPTKGVVATANGLTALTTRVSTAEGNISSLTTSVTNLNNTIVTKTTTFAQTTAPSTTGRVIGDLWIDTDDGNKLYTWNGTAWAVRAYPQQNKIWTQVAQPPTIGNLVGDLWIDTDDGNKMYRWTGTSWSLADDGRISTNSSAITTLDSRVTAVEGVNTSQSAAITSLQNTVNDATTGVVATANGLASLTTRVTNAEGVNTSQGTAITNLQNTVNNGTTGVVATANALSALTTRVTNTENTNTSQGDAITALQNTVNNGTTGVVATANAVSALTTRVSSIEGVNTSQGNAITSLQNTVNDSTTGVVATANAVTALTTRVTNAENVNSSQASMLTSLNSTVNNPTTGVTATASAVSSLNTEVDALTGKVNASYGLVLDVNGYVSGFSSTNDGITSTFDILADKFRIVTPGSTPKVPFSVSSNKVYVNTDLYMGNGRIVAQSGGFMKVQGVGFGTANQFIEWFGPVMAISSCSESNAKSYLKVNGDAYFGGSLSAGTLYNGATTTSTAVPTSAVVGPFASNGTKRNVILSYNYYKGSSYGSNIGNGTGGTVTLHFYRTIGAAAETLVGTYTVVCDRFSDPNGDGTWDVSESGSGSWTYADTSGGTSIKYRLEVTSRSGMSTVSGTGLQFRQSAGVTSTEG